MRVPERVKPLNFEHHEKFKWFEDSHSDSTGTKY